MRMNEFSKFPVILDGDPGQDDAIAWMMAGAAPEMEILAVTAEAGNQTIDKVSVNARRVCTLLGIDAPIAAGPSRPLLTDLIAVGELYGRSGLDGPRLPEAAMPLSELTAVELMAKTLRESPEPVTIVATGPETTIAALLLAHPELKSRIRLISVMGGGLSTGSWTPAAEFNILADPEAARIVFSSGVPIQMCPLDVTQHALVTPEEFGRIRAIGNQVAGAVADWLEFFYRFHHSIGYSGAPLHDPCAVAALLRPELFTMRDLYVAVETAGEYCRGATVGDLQDTTGHAPNVRCVMDLDREGFVRLLMDSVRTYDGWEVRV